MRMKKGEASRFPFPLKPGAGDESRTRDLNLGKVALYQLSYSRIADRTLSTSLGKWSGRRVSNSRPQPWQGCALPTELLPHSSCEGFEFYTVFRDWQEHSSKKNEKYHKHGIRRSFFRRFQAIRGGRAPLARPYSDRPPSLRLSQPSGRRAHACARACR